MPQPQARSEQSLLVPYAWMGVLALVWGVSFLFIKLGVRDMSPAVLALTRHIFGTLTLGAILLVQGKRLFRPQLRRLWPTFAVMALLSSVYPWMAIGWGELHISSGLASIFNATTPIWTAIFAYWVTPTERPSGLAYVGVAGAFAGTAILVAPNLISHGLSGDVLGALAVLSAAAAYASGALFQRRRLAGVGSVEAPFWQLLVGTVPLLLIAAPSVGQTHLSRSGLLAALFLGVAASGFAYIIYYYLLNTLGGTRAATTVFLAPITAVFWGVAILHETLTLQTLVAMAIILAGVVLTSRRRRTAPLSAGSAPPSVAVDADA